MQKKWLIAQIISVLITQLSATMNAMARDYFTYNNISSVVFFSCTNMTNNYHLTNMFNDQRISVAILNQESKYSHPMALRLNHWRLGVFLDSSCKYEYNHFILTKSSKYMMYNESYRWLLVGENLNDTIRMIDDDAFSISTNFVIAVPANHGYDLYDVFNHAKSHAGQLNVTRYGYWHKDTGLTVTLLQIKYQRRANLHGMRLKVISVTQYRPDEIALANYLQNDTTRPLDSMSKLGFAVLLHVADIFNFTMDIIETGLWDQVASDGSHFGMIGMLNQSEADFGTTCAIMFEKRTHLCDLVGPVWPFRTCFMFRSKPFQMSDVVFKVFTLECWTIILIVLVLCTIILFLSLKLEYFKDKILKWEMGILITIGIMCQQGLEFTPRYPSGRIIFLQLWIFSLLWYNYFSASFVSVKLYQPINKMNDSLHQLAESEYQIGAEPITYTNFGFVYSDDWETRDFYVKKWRPLTDEQRYISLEEGFRRVIQGEFAYHTDPNTGYPYVERYFTNQMICELTEVHFFKPQPMALWGRRNNPFTKIARIGLAKVSSTGLLTRELKRWVSRTPICDREVLSVSSVSLLETAVTFLILCTGIILAIILCTIENVYNFQKLRHESKKLN